MDPSVPWSFGFQVSDLCKVGDSRGDSRVVFRSSHSVYAIGKGHLRKVCKCLRVFAWCSSSLFDGESSPPANAHHKLFKDAGSMPGPGADLCTITHSKCSEHIESYESISGYKWTWWYSRSSCKRRT
eukprot:scaffold265544_cov17-Tisochrysis_lutea.AAC.1